MRATRKLSAFLGATTLAAGLALIPTNANAARVVPCNEAALVAAITTANSNGGGSLQLAPLCTYTLTAPHAVSGNGPSGLPVITTPISLNGFGTDIARAPGAPDFRIVEVDALTPGNAGSLNLTALTLRGGKAEPGAVGGGIANFGGTVRLNSSTLRNNAATAGGGLYNDIGTSSLVGSFVVGNVATSSLGGGIYENSGAVTLTSTFVGNNTPNNCAPPGSVPNCTN
jgi:hypothetical protein